MFSHRTDEDRQGRFSGSSSRVALTSSSLILTGDPASASKVMNADHQQIAALCPCCVSHNVLHKASPEST